MYVSIHFPKYYRVPRDDCIIMIEYYLGGRTYSEGVKALGKDLHDVLFDGELFRGYVTEDLLCLFQAFMVVCHQSGFIIDIVALFCN